VPAAGTDPVTLPFESYGTMFAYSILVPRTQQTMSITEREWPSEYCTVSRCASAAQQQHQDYLSVGGLAPQQTTHISADHEGQDSNNDNAPEIHCSELIEVCSRNLAAYIKAYRAVPLRRPDTPRALQTVHGGPCEGVLLTQ
jgi:hypothetical protein